MDIKIKNAVQEAKKQFNFKDITGNIFDEISKDIYFEKYGLLIFREDIGKLSGFIAYPSDNVTIICINYKRALGHQNFTLAHELGHYFLHSKVNMDDNEKSLNNLRVRREKEANEFASELLYPEELFNLDYKMYFEKFNLRNEEVNLDFTNKIDELCHKCCVSFDFILNKVCYIQRVNKQDISKKIKKLTNGFGKYYDPEFYVTTSGAPYYEQYKRPYNLLKEDVAKLLKDKQISSATAESILYSNGIIKDISEIQ